MNLNTVIWVLICIFAYVSNRFVFPKMNSVKSGPRARNGMIVLCLLLIASSVLEKFKYENGAEYLSLYCLVFIAISALRLRSGHRPNAS